jgi:NAD(P)-dependent dehydrogenase (short-subunit alcohol dehydrogenase family)
MTKTILITGSTDGIGLVTAKMLAEQGHRVILHGRSADKIAAAVAEIGGDVESFQADLSKISEVKAFASAVLEKHNTLDVLVNNAGVLKTPSTKTAEGLDTRFMVNTLAPYALTKALLPIIPQDGRVVNLSSAAQAPVDIDALANGGALGDMPAYSQSKLAITIWTREMAKTLPDGPAIIAVNPGSLLASKMVKEGFGVEGSDLSKGAEILIKASLSEEFADATGRYFDNDSGHFANPHPAALDTAHSADVMNAIESTLAKLDC